MPFKLLGVPAESSVDVKATDVDADHVGSSDDIFRALGGKQ